MIEVNGTFFRAVDPAHIGAAFDGSIAAGRYNAGGQRTLYLSASREGVAAAMIKHTAPGDPERVIVAARVTATDILDLRDTLSCKEYGIDAQEAFGDWQTALENDERPASWRVRDTAESLGAEGLIDPSRKRPGLWHLTLFRWNEPGAPTVELL